MDLSAMDIYELLPQTNCGKCGHPTCLAFAMQLANKQVSLDECPDVSEEAKAELASASAPPIKEVVVKRGDRELPLGMETVMFRHEETFHNQPGIGGTLSDTLSEDELEERLERYNDLTYERIGETIEFEVVGLNEESGDADQYADFVGQVLETCDRIPVLMSEDPEIIQTALDENEELKEEKPLIYAATEDNCEAMAEIAAENEIPLAVCGDGLEELAELTEKIEEAGAEELILDPGARDPLTGMQNQTQIRRQALENNFRPLGYPTMAFAAGEDAHETLMEACTYVCKYAGIILLEDARRWQALPVTVLRQNIYTDPRVPPTVEAKVFEVGEDHDENAPVLMTTNFALTYFTVASEVESSRVPSYIVTVDTEGQSVLTAYSSENLTAEVAANALNDTDLTDKIDHKEVIIPGHVAVMSGELEVESGWDVVVGPREASGLPGFLRDYSPNGQE
ncbi:acetyl-CoA decarbonylase/synthase complex subunit gamma [Halarsenatibacter silvermanii]|uniref:CO-methylating acetyl-CoA synthase corrinoid iron-sulfur protein large subunit n=1 Tax=Halarsenatibacter silvermanii TaxID=321763 RepID=A0A1G9H5J2_9FIRM|nr:acetyl-CoA decarbonylase/synthase complex subunit gamma [Halarsenatibacter silvermanii]SDL08145.1 CO-methylating acetyl-CoA synthase corrinoid iron-sulfur protein large subunit precursor [Halarsenatibacter silvermanii]